LIFADAPTPAPSATASCAAPNVPPRVITLVRPIGAERYIEINRKGGTVDVKVYLARDGSVEKAVIVHSSGDAFLDGATYDAAVATTYAAEIRDCEGVSGAYIYRTKYNSEPVPQASATPATSSAPTPGPAAPTPMAHALLTPAPLRTAPATPAPTPVPTPQPIPATTLVPTTVATTVPTTVPTTVATTVPTTVPTTVATTVPTTVPTTIATTVATSVPTTVVTTVPAKP
jgi:TonB family protein